MGLGSTPHHTQNLFVGPGMGFRLACVGGGGGTTLCEIHICPADGGKQVCTLQYWNIPEVLESWAR